MARGLLWKLFRPRHLAGTLLAFLLPGGLGGLVVGYVEAQSIAEEDTDDALPDPALDVTFVVAEPRSGDRLTYRFGGNVTQSMDWLPDVKAPDGNGTRRWGNQIRIREDHVQPDGSTTGADIVHLVEPGTLSAFAWFYGSNETQDVGEYEIEEVEAAYSFPTGSGVPCYVRNPLQGTTVHLGAPPIGNAMCWDEHLAELHVRGVQQEANVTYLVVDATSQADPGLFQRLWFVEGIPYPVQTSWSNGGWCCVGTWTMEAFERGVDPVRGTTDAEPGKAPPTVMAPRQTWGPDDAGTTHPWPLSQAFADARDAPTFSSLRDFLDGHPGAYMLSAYPSAYESNAAARARSWSWRFTMSDGTDQQQFSATREEPAPPAGLPIPATTVTEFWADEVRPAQGEPVADQLPAALPTVASMIAQWRHYGNESLAEEAVEDWSFRFHCSGCDRPETITLHAGFAQRQRTYATEPTPLADSNEFTEVSVTSAIDYVVYGQAEFDGPTPWGHPVSLHESRREWRRPSASGGVPPAPEEAAPPAVDLKPAVDAQAFWVRPTPQQAAAIGLAAFLTAFLYWIAPALKAGPAALFSRLRRDALLDNPIRRTLVERIEAEPGVHHQVLVRLVGKGNGTVEHHLGKLVAAGLVQRLPAKGYTCYFPPGSDLKAAASAPLLRSATARAVLEMRKARPGMSLAAMAAELGTSVPTVHYHLSRMRAAGLVDDAAVAA